MLVLDVGQHAPAAASPCADCSHGLGADGSAVLVVAAPARSHGLAGGAAFCSVRVWFDTKVCATQTARAVSLLGALDLDVCAFTSTELNVYNACIAAEQRARDNSSRRLINSTRSRDSPHRTFAAGPLPHTAAYQRYDGLGTAAGRPSVGVWLGRRGLFFLLLLVGAVSAPHLLSDQEVLRPLLYVLGVMACSHWGPSSFALAA